MHFISPGTKNWISSIPCLHNPANMPAREKHFSTQSSSEEPNRNLVDPSLQPGWKGVKKGPCGLKFIFTINLQMFWHREIHQQFVAQCAAVWAEEARLIPRTTLEPICPIISRWQTSPLWNFNVERQNDVISAKSWKVLLLFWAAGAFSALFILKPD